MFGFIAVLLGIAALVVYYKGVRNEMAWSLQLMTVLVIGAVIAAILPLTPLQDVLDARGVSVVYQPYEQIGRKLRGELSRDDNVLVVVERMEEMMLSEDPDEGDLEEELSQHAGRILDAIESGARTRLNLAGSVNLRDSGARAWNSAIEEYEDHGISLIVSQTFQGLPVTDMRNLEYELEDLVCFQWQDVPLFVADVGHMYNPAMLREYFRDGLLSAVSLAPETGAANIAVDADSAGDIPSSAPVGPYAR